MSSYGLTTGYFSNWAAAITSNTPFVMPVNAIQLYTGAPGPAGTANVSLIGVRQLCQLTFASNIISLTGTTPTWYNVPDAEDITGFGLCTDLTAGYVWVTAPLANAEIDAVGDTFTITAITLPFTVGVAS
jgi:hypothetical protein